MTASHSLYLDGDSSDPRSPSYDDSSEAALDDWFASLPDAKRAELMWDFMDRRQLIAGVCGSKIEQPAYGRIVTVETDLSGDFMSWLADSYAWKAERAA